LNILYLFGHNLVLGGHFKSAQAFITELVKKGHSVHAMAPGGNKDTIQPFYDAGASFSNLLLNSHRINKINTIQRVFFINNQISKAILKYDIDVIHAQDSSIMVEGYKAACFYRKPFIITQAGGKFIDIKPPNRTFLILYSGELLEGYQEQNKTRNTTLCIITERVNQNIYRPINVARDDLINNYCLPADGFNFFFSMRIHPQKEQWINTLLYFAKKILIKNSINFLIAGNGPLLDSMKEKVKNITNHRPNVNFYFLGVIYNDIELMKLINYSDVCIGNGRSLMEAMACRKPLIILGENRQYELVDKNNIEIIRKYNFSGRHFKFVNYNESKQKHRIKSLIEANKLNEISDFLFEYFVYNLSAKIGTEKLIGIYYTAINERMNRIKIRCFVDYLIWRLKRFYSKQ